MNLNQRQSFRSGQEYLRSLLFLSPFILLFFISLIQVFNLTIIQGDKYQTIAESNRIYQKTINPVRGFIYDHRGELLVENVVQRDLYVTPAYIENPNKTLLTLSDLLGLSFEGLESIYFSRALKIKNYDSFPLVKSLNEEQIAKIKVNIDLISGVEVISSLKRYVLHDQTLAHIIGYVGDISLVDIQNDNSLSEIKNSQIGKTGIEKEFDFILRGKPGYQTQERDVKGKLVRVLDTEGAKDGENIYLSIDKSLQTHLFKLFKGRKGALVALEPKTGLVRALISSPSYDPNILNSIVDSTLVEKLFDNQDSPIFNRAISGQYPPASTLKPFVGLAAIENRVISWEKKIRDNGKYFVEGDPRPYRGWKENGHGNVDMRKAIIESSDVYFYNLAYDLTLSGIKPMLENFGFGKKTGLTPFESSGLLPDKKWKLGYKGDFWFKGDTINLGIGQGYILSTPLQLAVAYSGLANKGIIYKPLFIQPSDEKTYKPEKIAHINLSDEGGWEKMEKALIDVIAARNGTAHKVFDKNSKVIAGKTGTAQIKSILPGKEYDAIRENPLLRDHALFVGYGPVNDPKLVVAVIIENGESGSEVAAPIVQSAINFYSK
ncbi:MAG: penicillin-binding protein 2 [Gammaproteobacteria bacterium]|nr:MAG: penicillin-binding protein 2 [Gammaproteobacteria bacterium]